MEKGYTTPGYWKVDIGKGTEIVTDLLAGKG
jgi:hypothetical protein